MNKLFYWSPVDPMSTYQPTLWIIDEAGSFQQSYDMQADLKRILEDGYREISFRTAYHLGFCI